MQFYLQSAIVEKGVQIEDYSLSRLDVIVGCIVTDVVAFFIVLACGATIYKAGGHIESARDAAVALKPLAGEWASALFAFGQSCRSASTLGPTSYARSPTRMPARDPLPAA